MSDGMYFAICAIVIFCSVCISVLIDGLHSSLTRRLDRIEKKLDELTKELSK